MSHHRFWNDPRRLYRESTHQKLRNARSVCVPGCIGDRTDRGQPGRFDKWNKLPASAHRLFWRVRGMR
jgi:hypothetical protein